jgi:AcrR family transcriptional regulator
VGAMSQSFESLEKRWEDYTNKLINVSAKKQHAIDTKQQQIVEGACRVFFRKGFHPTSIREIAEAAGMSLGQMYHYISSKDDVLFLIHKHMQISWYRNIEDSRIDEIEDPYERLEKALASTVHFLVENKKLIQFVYSESKYLNKKHLRVVLDMDNRIVVQYWRNLLKDVLGEHASDTYVEHASNLIEYLMVFYPLRGWNLKDISNDELSNFLIEFIYKGLGLSRLEGLKSQAQNW